MPNWTQTGADSFPAATGRPPGRHRALRPRVPGHPRRSPAPYHQAMRAEPRRYAGVAAVAVLWGTLGAAAAVSRFPLLGRRPLSWLADDPAGSVLFGAGLGVGALLLAGFHGWVRTRFAVNRSFSVVLLAGLAGQAVAAVVPISGGPWAARAHTVAALTLGASLPVAMWRFAAAQPPGRWRRTARYLASLEVLAVVAGLALSRHSVAPLAEILPAGAFHLWIVALTFASPRHHLSLAPAPRSSHAGNIRRPAAVPLIAMATTWGARNARSHR